MAAVRDGRQEAFAAIFERYRAPIWSFFRRRAPDRETAAELTQDLFATVLAAAPKYQARGAFRSYLFGVASNLWSSWRRRPREPIGSTSLVDLDPPAPSADPDAVLWVRRALEALDPIDRDILMLREYDALKYDEIAAVLNLPVNTVRSRLFRARLALKEQLDARSVAERSHA